MKFFDLGFGMNDQFFKTKRPNRLLADHATPDLRHYTKLYATTPK